MHPYSSNRLTATSMLPVKALRELFRTRERTCRSMLFLSAAVRATREVATNLANIFLCLILCVNTEYLSLNGGLVCCFCCFVGFVVLQ